MKRAMQWIFALSLFGVAFSGVLTYREFFGATATACPAPGAPGTVFGYPACAYGLLLYLALSLISGSALYYGRRPSVG